MVEKKNPDYSGSAVKLCNPAEVGELLAQRLSLTGSIADLKDELEALELYRQIQETEKTLRALDEEIKQAIETHGSYQDTETGIYGVKQRKLSVIYVPGLVRDVIPKFADAVIEEVVNKIAIEGLIKGKLITPEQADKISNTTENFAFIIK